ncbi:Rrf2 family protein [Motilibacter peucedani]|uniref:Rrf2 family protein n=1 Tax=Motilibacter peucedani TaxID=598650 RepID=A0A420XMA7_9ACTN|nr:Rrf2 family transcriptional regulator [Motilibacter peucedani]RKS71448.1 Rrf2 family protein [Motilibacter peucedani]
MRITAKADYAVRAAAHLAAAEPGVWVKADAIAAAQRVPNAFLLTILAVLRDGGIVESRRGLEGGYRLAHAPKDLVVADIIRAIDGPLASISGKFVEEMEYDGAATHLRETWVALRAAIRGVLEQVTLEALVSGDMPEHVQDLLADKENWTTRPPGLRA